VLRSSLALFAAAAAAAFGISPLAWAQSPWPAEDFEDALNLTSVEGPEPNDFYVDLSGAVWNPETRTLWVCRNGPVTASKLWALREDGAGSFVVDTRGGVRAEWTNFGDLEAVAQAEWGEDAVYLMIEGEERIKEYDVSAFGKKTLVNDWNTRPFLPRVGAAGSEGLTFVPDEFLSRAGFVDRDGIPFTSALGMNGVMMVGHQNGGGIFVFDLDRATGDFSFVGEYRTAYDEIAGLEFDRSTGFLFVWHDENNQVLELIDLRSSGVAGETFRQFEAVRLFAGPSRSNFEGIAITPAADCANGERSLFMTIDGGGPTSLLLFQRFSVDCPEVACLEGSVNAGGSGGVENVLFVNGSFGDPETREVRVPLFSPIEVELRAASAGSRSGRYGLWLWRGPPSSPVTLAFQGRTIGCVANPTPFHPGLFPQPFRCILGAGVPRAFCDGAAEVTGFGALAVPWIAIDPLGLGAPGSVITLQGVIEDRGASEGPGFSVTNGIVIRAAE
jgi:hypothetical protein